jgi:hypothetical protein
MFPRDRPRRQSPEPLRTWSIYGAQRAQPVATGRKRDALENRSNKPIRNRRQPTATVSERIVRRGRRFESVRGLCKSAARRRFCVHIDLLLTQRAVGMEPFMELSSRKLSRWPGVDREGTCRQGE